MITPDPQIKEQVREQKLRQLMVRFIELEFEKVAHLANNLTQASEMTQKEIDKIVTAYEAIQNS